MPSIADENNIFLSKEKADSFLQERSRRGRRYINEECREPDGCSYEELHENGVSDVVFLQPSC